MSCLERRADLAAAGIADRNITFLGNAPGTYLFNLIRLTRNRETFDIIYLDGSHSIYVDLASAVAAIRLLRPGALFLFDDVRFSFGRRHLIQTTAQYADANEAGQLTEDEASEAHVTIIIRDYLFLCSALSWSGRGRILIGSHSERQSPRGCGFDGSPMIALRDRRLHRCHERSRRGSPSWHA